IALLVMSTCVVLTAQAIKPVPRPPALPPGTTPEGSAAPDGYAPSPQWLRQTRAPRPAQTAADEVTTLVEGLPGAFSFALVPADGCIIVAERGGRLRILDANMKLSEPLEGLPKDLFARGGQGLYEVRPDRAFATNRTLYLTYTVLPEGADPANLPRSPGV